MRARFQDAGLRLALPQRLPANDAAIAFGQVIEAAARKAAEE
jgi:hydrogenase maturation factor HypF (carbamoyltransferase family)